MTWTPVAIHVPPPPVQDDRPMISLANYRRSLQGADQWKICITFKKSMMDQLSWIRPGAPFSMVVGEGEHHGLLRIEQGGESLFAARNGAGRGRNSKVSIKAGTAAPGPPDSRLATVFFRPFVWVDLVKRVRVDMAYRTGTTPGGVGWIELTLPLWAAKPAEPVKAPFTLGGPPIGRPSAPIPLTSQSRGLRA